LPSFLVGALVASPLVKSPRIAEYAVMALAVLLAFPIWRGIGSRLDQRIEAKQISIHAALGGCLAFDTVCLVGALTLSGAFGLGPLVWIAGAVPLWRVRVTSPANGR